MLLSVNKAPQGKSVTVHNKTCLVVNHFIFELKEERNSIIDQ